MQIFTPPLSNKLKLFWVAVALGAISFNQLEAVTIFDANFDNSPFTTALSSNAVTAVSDLGAPTVGTWRFSNLPVGRITVNSNSTDKAFAVGSNIGQGIPNMTEMADVGVTFGPLPDTEVADSSMGDVVKAVFSQPGRFSLDGEQTRISFDWGTFGQNDSADFKYCFVTGYDSNGRQVFELLLQAGYTTADRNVYARSATDSSTTVYSNSIGVPQGTAVLTGIPDGNVNSIGLKPSDMLKVTIVLTNNQVTYGFDLGTLSSNLIFNLNSAATNITELRWSAIWNASRPGENKGYWLDNVNVSFLTNSPADHLVIEQEPANTPVGHIISPAVTVLVVDQYGNPTSSSTNVSIGIGNNPGGGTLGGTLTVAATNGVATFSDLSIDKTGSGYTLVASAPGLTGTNSSTFNIFEPGVADHLAIGQQPGNEIAGQAFSQAVTVDVEDPSGNIVATNVSISINLGNDPGGATLSGTLTVAATDGVATFSDLSIDKTGSRYTLAASTPGLIGTNSVVFDVTRTWQSGFAFIYTNGTYTMPYRVYLPWQYNASMNYPLVLFLHGSGEYGTDNVAQVATHIAGLINRTYSDFPAVLVAPQLDTSYWSFTNPNDLALGILARVRQYYAVDERRLYLTGLSAGGYGTTDYAINFPTLFAAIVPMSGAENVTPGSETQIQLSKLPTWLFHGSADTVVPVSTSRDYYMNVTGLTNIVFTQTNYGYPTAVSSPIRYTEFTGKGHDIWELIYGATNTDFYDWMFSQIRPPSTFTFNAESAANGQFVVGGSNSVPFATSYLLTSTNMLTPISQWQCVATNWCDANGSLAFTNALNTAESQRFYILKAQ